MKKTYVHNGSQRSQCNARNNMPCCQRPDMNAVLRKANVDTEGYLSLRVHQSLLPSDSELIVQIRNKQTGELFTLNLNDDDNHLLGKNSRFYGQMMADGNIFNPYIHRRFITVQFRDLVKRFGIDGVRNAVSKERDWKYAIEQVRKECHVLANLERRDRQGFADRSRFFTMDAVNAILRDYVCEVFNVIDMAATHANRNNRQIYVRGYGMIDRNNIRPMKHRFEMLLVHARNCRTYTELDRLLEKFDFMELARHLMLPDSFVTPFINAGAYNALKNAVMFEGKTIYGNDTAGSLRILDDAVQRSSNGAMELYRYAG